MLLVYMPIPHSGVDDNQVLKNQRLLEDKLIAQNLNIHGMISIHYYVHEEHHNERRHLAHFVRACNSKSLGETEWVQAEPTRGKLGPLPLIKVKDMEGCDMESGVRISAAARTAQRGVEAWSLMLKSFVTTMGFSQNDMILIVDFNLRQSSAASMELPKAVHSLQMANDQGAAMIAYCGGSCDNGVAETVSSSLSCLMLEEWWNRCPAAGPIQRPTRGSEREAPPLKALAFMDGVPTFPAALLERFQPSSDHWQTIQDLKGEHHKKFPASVAPQVATQSSPPSGTQTSLPLVIPLPSCGPDYSVQPPRNIREMLDLESIPLAELKRLREEGKLWLCC